MSGCLSKQGTSETNAVLILGIVEEGMVFRKNENNALFLTGTNVNYSYHGEAFCRRVSQPYLRILRNKSMKRRKNNEKE